MSNIGSRKSEQTKQTFGTKFLTDKKEKEKLFVSSEKVDQDD